MKKLLFPQEFDVWYILPAIRKKLALKLIERGMLQKEIAQILQISEATITHYKKKQRVKEDLLGNEVNELIEEAVINITKNNNLLVSEVLKINDKIKEQGLFCKIYQDKSELKLLPCVSCKESEENYCY